jgi:hypothetical protein
VSGAINRKLTASASGPSARHGLSPQGISPVPSPVAAGELEALRALPGAALPKRVAKYVARGAWETAHTKATRAERLTLVIDMMLTRPNKLDRWPGLLATAIAASDFPRREYARVCALLRLLHERGLRAFDSEASRFFFDHLPPRVPIFRGTSHAEFESGELGVSWSLHRFAAEAFAMRSGIAQHVVAAAERPDIGNALMPGAFGSTPSEPVLLTATIDREDAPGLLTRLGEHEVLVCPERLRDVRCERFDLDTALGETATLLSESA